MDKIVSAFLQRNIPDLKDSFTVEFEESSRDFFRITAQNGKSMLKRTIISPLFTESTAI